MSVDFSIDRESRKTLSEQLVWHFRREIESGNLKAGEKLPTRNELVSRLGVSKNVVETAVAKLVAEGLVCTRPRIGCTVRDCRKRIVQGHVLYVLAENDGAYSSVVFGEAFASQLNKSGIRCTRVSIPRSCGRRADYSWLQYELSLRPDLVVVNACALSAPGVIGVVEASAVPYVLMYARNVRAGRRCVAKISVDSTEAVRSFAADCVSRNVLSVCFVGFGKDSFVDPTKALEHSGVCVERLEIPLGTVFANLDGIQKIALQSVASRLSLGHLSQAFFFGDDYLAFGAMGALLEAGLRIPQDVGFATEMNQGFSPCFAHDLTGIRFDSRTFADAVVRGIVHWLSSGDFPQDLCLIPKYVPGRTLSI